MKITLAKQTNSTLVFTTETMPNLEVGKIYEVKPFKRNRTLEQNALLWKILNIIQDHTGQDKWDIYTDLLEKTGVMVEYLEAPLKAEGTLKRIFRIVKLVENRVSQKVKPTALFKVYVGSSQFKTKEMKQLIDNSLDLVYSLGLTIDIDTLESED